MYDIANAISAVSSGYSDTYKFISHCIDFWNLKNLKIFLSEGKTINQNLTTKTTSLNFT